MENMKLNLRSSVITPRPFPSLLAWFPAVLPGFALCLRTNVYSQKMLDIA